MLLVGQNQGVRQMCMHLNMHLSSVALSVNYDRWQTMLGVLVLTGQVLGWQ